MLFAGGSVGWGKRCLTFRSKISFAWRHVLEAGDRRDCRWLWIHCSLYPWGSNFRKSTIWKKIMQFVEQLFLSDLESILQFFHDSIIELLVKKFFQSRCWLKKSFASWHPMWSVRRQRCAILSRCYLRGDRGTCEPQDLKDWFLSRDSKKNETAKGFAHFEDLASFSEFRCFAETFSLHSKVPTDPYLQYENPHRVSTHVARKGVVFFWSSWIWMGIWNICFLDCLGDFSWNNCAAVFHLQNLFFKTARWGEWTQCFFLVGNSFGELFWTWKKCKVVIGGRWMAKRKTKSQMFFSGWCFFILLIFTHICGRCPFWLIFFKGVASTTN